MLLFPGRERIVLDHPLRVVVVDDYREFRTLLNSIVHTQPEWQVVAEACNGEEAVRRIEALRPDLVLLDIGLPALNGFEVTRIIRATVPESKIVFVSQESSAEAVQEALSLGADGYVLKAHVASELLVAVKAVLQGTQFLSRTLVDRPAS